MSHEPLDELFDSVRSIEPTPGAKARVRAAIDERRGPRRVRWWIPTLAVAAVAGALVLWIASGDQEVHNASPEVARAPEQPPSAIEETYPPILVASNDTLRMRVAMADVIARGPASLSVEDERLILHEGGAAIDGSVEVEGGMCRARVAGRCEVRRFEHSLRFIVEAGDVQILSPRTTCSIIELEAPAEEASNDQAPRRRPRAEGPSELAQQTQAYREAIALQGQDDAAALTALRSMRRRWPRGPLAPEVDFQIVRTLVRLDRMSEARRAAGAFVERYPRSGRAAEMQTLVDSDGTE